MSDFKTTYYSDLKDLHSITTPVIDNDVNMNYRGHFEKFEGNKSFDFNGCGLTKTRNNKGVIFCPDSAKLFSVGRGYVGLSFVFPRDIIDGKYSLLMGRDVEVNEYLLWGVNPGVNKCSFPSVYSCLTKNGISFTVWSSNGKWTIYDDETSVVSGDDVFIEYSWNKDGFSEFSLDIIPTMSISTNGVVRVVSDFLMDDYSLENKPFYIMDTGSNFFNLNATIKKIVVKDSCYFSDSILLFDYQNIDFGEVLSGNGYKKCLEINPSILNFGYVPLNEGKYEILKINNFCELEDFNYNVLSLYNHNGNIFIGFNGGFAVYSLKDQICEYFYIGEYQGDSVQSFCVDKLDENIIYIGSRFKIWKFDIEQKELHEFDELVLGGVSVIVPSLDDNNHLYFAGGHVSGNFGHPDPEQHGHSVLTFARYEFDSERHEFMGNLRPLGFYTTYAIYPDAPEVRAVAIDPLNTNRIYFGGTFQAAENVSFGNRRYNIGVRDDYYTFLAGGINASGFYKGYSVSCLTFSENVEDRHLYVGGSFTHVDNLNNIFSPYTIQVNRFAKFNVDEREWFSLSGGTNGTVSAMAFDPNNHNILYIGGGFTLVGGIESNRIAAYDVKNDIWIPIESELNGAVTSLVFGDNGVLYVGGSFTKPYNYFVSYDVNEKTWGNPLYNDFELVKDIKSSNESIFFDKTSFQIDYGVEEHVSVMFLPNDFMNLEGEKIEIVLENNISYFIPLFGFSELREYVIPSEINFGSCVLNKVKEMQIEIKNIGSENLKISEMFLDFDDVFSFDNYSLEILPLQYGYINVYFEPLEVLNYESIFYINSNFGFIEVVLKGSGIDENDCLGVNIL